MFEIGHGYALAGEADALAFEAEALLEGAFGAEGDASTGGDDAVPGEVRGALQGANGEAGSTGDSGGYGDGPVGGDFAAWNLADGGADRQYRCGFNHRYVNLKVFVCPLRPHRLVA